MYEKPINSKPFKGACVLMVIKLYGKEAQELDDKDQYKVVKYTIEGRLVAELIPLSVCYSDVLEYICDKCDL